MQNNAAAVGQKSDVMRAAKAITGCIDKGMPVSVQLDVDGTSTPFKEKVEDAVVNPTFVELVIQSNELVQKLFGPKVRWGFLSGRAFPDAVQGLGGEKLLRGSSLMLGSDHGSRLQDCETWQEDPNYLKGSPLRAAAEKFQTKIAESQVIQKLSTEQRKNLNEEHKVAGYAISVNQLKPEQTDALKAEFESIARQILISDTKGTHPMLGDFQIELDKGVLEIRPKNITKGTAIQALESIGLPEGKGKMVMIGDAKTDEDGYKAARDMGGFGIHVGIRRPDLKGKPIIVRNTQDTAGSHLENSDGTLNQKKRTEISERNVKHVHQIMSLVYQHLKEMVEQRNN